MKKEFAESREWGGGEARQEETSRRAAAYLEAEECFFPACLLHHWLCLNPTCETGRPSGSAVVGLEARESGSLVSVRLFLSV